MRSQIIPSFQLEAACQRIIALLVVASVLVSSDAVAQTEGSEQASGDAPAEAIVAAQIIGEVPDGSPQPSPPPLAKLDVRPSDILSRNVARTFQREIAFEKTVPMVLPKWRKDTPPPLIQDSSISASVEPEKPSKNLMLGASVYALKGAPENAVTRLQLWSTANSQPIVLLCNANFLWLTGFAEFETPAARYSLLMAISADAGDELPNEYEFSQPGIASLIVEEGTPTPEDLAPIEALLKLYNDPVEKAKLRSAYEGRKAEGQRLAALRAADPPEKKNIVLRYWRMDSGKKVSEQSKGGAQ